MALPNDSPRVEIWHNPSCSKSRETLALIRAAGIEPAIVEYLRDPPSRSRLRNAIDEAGLSVRDTIRTTDAEYLEQGLQDPALGDEALLDAMLATPSLINRPFVLAPLGVRLCRPPEVVLDILPGETAESGDDAGG